jgi:hypothetical protein
MKYTLILLTALLLATSGQSCNKIRRNNGVITEEPEISGCFDESVSDERIIRTQQAYAALAQGPDGQQCPYGSFPEIDFDRYTLLGKYASGKCKAKFFRQVLQDDAAKTVTFNILVKDRGLCKSAAISWNWVLVPKIPEDYTITFNVEEK